ncbi:cupin domain-containing protein [Rhizobium pusense]|uniref:cupin domain-containing protein n=1 Tax=Agrobacterium pusense TaxID=648995 RepID=UPI000DDA2EA3|nr:cupin domain-containing protein [Agrobacterium pusense]MCJ2877484.1 cupin domain-containing protein [Agrobacterium pusense]
MSNLKTVQTSDLGPGVTSHHPAERLIEGNPVLRSWKQDEHGTINTGVWMSEPGLSVSIKGPRYEFCYILEGLVEITEDGQQPLRYTAGDSFVMKPGFVGTWRTIETVKKIYVVVD